MQLPDGFVSSLSMLSGYELDAFICALQKPACRAVRFSARRGIVPQPWCTDRVPWAEKAWYIDEDARPGAMTLHWAGAYYIQEPSAMAAVGALGLEAGQKVLDLCAAPGGKASQIADLMAGEGLLVANDPVVSRAKELSRNLERMGVANAIVLSNKPEQLAKKFTAYFDRILVDAPCSGEGMFRKNPEMMRSWHPGLPGELARHQQHILAQAARMLKPGGRLAYSTCTFNRTENEDIIESFLKHHRDFTLKPFALPGFKNAKAGMLRIWPHETRGEGHFIALLERTSDSGSPACSGADSNTMRDDKRRTLEEVNNKLASWMEAPVQADGLLGETAVRLPKPCPDLEGLFVLRLGLHISSIQGKTIRPHHALSAALYAKNRIQLGRDEAECFRKGEALSVPDELRDYCCAEHLGWPLGWGKAVDGILKNHYPKGLRNPGKAIED